MIFLSVMGINKKEHYALMRYIATIMLQYNVGSKNNVFERQDFIMLTMCIEYKDISVEKIIEALE